MNPVILGMRVDPTSFQEASESILTWARAGESRYVCVANVHMTMEAYDCPDFRKIVNSADMVVPDGMPLVWMLRKMGYPDQERVSGPDLMIWLLQTAAEQGVPVGFLGSTENVLNRLREHLMHRFPALKIAYSYSPPFRPLTTQEDEKITEEINASSTRILFLGLGCPKQERWIAAHKGRVRAVMLGVGAAFDFHAGVKARAPIWMQRVGLEWFFRLITEPQRLWYRYFYHNSRFLILALKQLVGENKNRGTKYS